MCLFKGTNYPTGTAGTKAILDADGFKAPRNRLQIYDFVDNGATPHINDQIGPDVPGSPLAQATAGVWPFVNGYDLYCSDSRYIFFQQQSADSCDNYRDCY